MNAAANQYSGPVVVFDLDDTLYRERDYVISAYTAVAEEASRHWSIPGLRDDALQTMTQAFRSGLNPLDALNEMERLRGISPTPADLFLSTYRYHRPSIRLSGEAEALLARLRAEGIPTAIVTDGRSATQRLKAEALGINRFVAGSDIYISEETGADKLCPDSFEAIEKTYPCATCYIYVGDNPAKDFFQPRARGWLTLMLRDSDGINIHPQAPPAPEYAAEAEIASLAEIHEIIDNKRYMKSEKVALITGITGQDGSFLAEFLLEKGYKVHGIIRRSSSFNTGRIEHLYLDEWVRDMKRSRLINLHYGDMTDSSSLISIIKQIRPTEIYNLAAQSHVKVSFEVPEYTADTDAIGTLRLLEAVRILGLENHTRIYQASTSELFGKVQEIPQRETTPFYPRSPYACAKLYAFWISKNYRESYGMFVANGILFNHESERRGENFVTRKITLAAARIAAGLQDKLYLGNLNALRDWGYARDYVECMWLILQQEKPDDYVIATGEQHSVREFTTLAFSHVGIKLRWEGTGADEKGIDEATGRVIVEVSPKYFRPAEVETLLGDPSKSREQLGWNPRKTTFEELVKIMVEADVEQLKKENRR